MSYNSTSKEKPKTSSNQIKEYKQVINERSNRTDTENINNYNSNQNTIKNPNNPVTMCLCNKVKEENLFDNNQCKLCGRNRLENSIKRNSAIGNSNSNIGKMPNPSQMQSKSDKQNINIQPNIQINNFVNSKSNNMEKPQQQQNFTINKVDVNQRTEKIESGKNKQNIDYTK